MLHTKSIKGMQFILARARQIGNIKFTYDVHESLDLNQEGMAIR